MKLITTLGMLSILFATATFGAETTKKVKFWVRGECTMCTDRIQETVMGIDGVKEARWDENNKMLTATIDTTKTKQDVLERAVAKAGHRTKKYAADEKAYDALPGCCKEK